jgi:hypothetical protein
MLKTTLTPPTSIGAVKSVTVDENGMLSFQNASSSGTSSNDSVVVNLNNTVNTYKNGVLVNTYNSIRDTIDIATIKKSFGNTKGDIITFSENDTPIILPGNTTKNLVLKTDPASASGLKWENANGFIQTLSNQTANVNFGSNFIDNARALRFSQTTAGIKINLPPLNTTYDNYLALENIGTAMIQVNDGILTPANNIVRLMPGGVEYIHWNGTAWKTLNNNDNFSSGNLTTNIGCEIVGNKIINIGNGTAAATGIKQINIGTTNASDATAKQINIGPATGGVQSSININGGGTQFLFANSFPGIVNFYNNGSAGTLNLANTGAKTLNIGSITTTSATNINGGTTGSLNLNNSTIGVVNISSGNNPNTVNIGNSTGGQKNINIGNNDINTVTTIRGGNTGTGAINLTSSKIKYPSTLIFTGATSLDANTAATVSIGEVYIWDDGNAYHLMIKK